MSDLSKTIFIMIPAYRDPILLETVESIFKNAANPDRVFVAIAAQYDDEMPMPDLSFVPNKNIRLLSIHPENRPGVYRLRHILNKLYAGEDYYMSVDSHTFFSRKWDRDLISLLESFEDKKTILQAYEPNFNDNDKKYYHYQMSVSLDNEAGVPRIVLKDFPERDVPADGEMPISNFIQASAIFARGSFAKEIRWGELWQNDSEEPFLSFEAFMLGWTARLMIKKRIFLHRPEKYYEAVYNTKPSSHIRDLRDNWNVQKDDLSEVCPKMFRAMISNTGPFKILNAVKSPKDWWESIGLIDEYEKYKDKY